MQRDNITLMNGENISHARVSCNRNKLYCANHHTLSKKSDEKTGAHCLISNFSRYLHYKLQAMMTCAKLQEQCMIRVREKSESGYRASTDILS